MAFSSRVGPIGIFGLIRFRQNQAKEEPSGLKDGAELPAVRVFGWAYKACDFRFAQSFAACDSSAQVFTKSHRSSQISRRRSVKLYDVLRKPTNICSSEVRVGLGVFRVLSTGSQAKSLMNALMKSVMKTLRRTYRRTYRRTSH